MDNLRLGDIIDDYCIKCRRMTNHAIVSIVNEEVAKVRCRSCYHDHDYLHEQIPPSKKDLKKMELFNAVLNKVDPSGEADSDLEADVDLDGENDTEAEIETEAEAPAAAAPAPAPAKKGRSAKKR